MQEKVKARLRELAPAARGCQEAGITQPSLQLFLHFCTLFSTQLVPLPYRIYTIYLSLIWETIFARIGVGLSVRASFGKQNRLKLKTKHSDRPST